MHGFAEKERKNAKGIKLEARLVKCALYPPSQKKRHIQVVKTQNVA